MNHNTCYGIQTANPKYVGPDVKVPEWAEIIENITGAPFDFRFYHQAQEFLYEYFPDTKCRVIIKKVYRKLRYYK